MGTYYDEYKNKVKTSTDEQKSVLKTQQTTADQIALDRLNADNEALEQGYGTQIDETKSSYDTALRTNEVQRALNERSIARRMAEMGLTDSGLNRTQSTAVQLSYANQKGNLIADKQKAVDTLAAAMRSQMAQNQLTYNENVANNKLAYESGVADIDAKVEADAITYESERIKADNEAIAKKNTARANLYSILGDQSKSQSEMTAAINSYALSYGLSDEEHAEFTRLANQTLTDAAASAFAKEAKSEISSMETFIYNSNNSDAAKLARIQSAYDKGYISSKQKTYYESLVNAVSQKNGVVDYNAVKKVKNDILSEEDFYERATVVERIGGRRGNAIGNNYSYDGRTYANYKEYVKAQLQDMYEKYEIIGEPELRDLLEYYKI